MIDDWKQCGRKQSRPVYANTPEFMLRKFTKPSILVPGAEIQTQELQIMNARAVSGQTFVHNAQTSRESIAQNLQRQNPSAALNAKWRSAV
jgi:hypothetical protein